MEQYALGRLSNSATAKDAASHELHTIHLLENDTELKDAIKKHWGDEAYTHAIKTIEKDTPILSDLLDGPIDIDKMDYLTRDSYHCGVRFGGGLDLQQLLRSLRCVDNGKHLGISEDGVSSVEGMMVLQDQMLAAVYWNEAIRGIIAMFHAIVAHLVISDVDKFVILANELKRCASDQEAVWNVFLPRAKKLPNNFKGKEKVLRLVELYSNPVYRDIYTPVARFALGDEKPKDHRINVFHTIVNLGTTSRSMVPIDWQQARDLRTACIQAFREKHIEVDPIDIVIDVPHGKNSRPMLKVRDNAGRSQRDFVQVTHLSESIFSDPARHLAPIRVYVEPTVREKAGSQLASILEAAQEYFFSKGSLDGVSDDSV